jgi:hypothetical protein
MDMGKYFPCEWRKKVTFSRELPEKSTRGHTDFIFGIESSLFGETWCKRRELIDIPFPK